MCSFLPVAVIGCFAVGFSGSLRVDENLVDSSNLTVANEKAHEADKHEQNSYSVVDKIASAEDSIMFETMTNIQSEHSVESTALLSDIEQMGGRPTVKKKPKVPTKMETAIHKELDNKKRKLGVSVVQNKESNDPQTKPVLTAASIQAMADAGDDDDADEDAEEDRMDREDNQRREAQERRESEQVSSATKPTHGVQASSSKLKVPAPDGSKKKQKRAAPAVKSKSTSVTQSPIKQFSEPSSKSQRHGTPRSVKKVVPPKITKPAHSSATQKGGATGKAKTAEDDDTSASAITQTAHQSEVDKEFSQTATEETADDPEMKGWKWVEKWVTSPPDSEPSD